MIMIIVMTMTMTTTTTFLETLVVQLQLCQLKLLRKMVAKMMHLETLMQLRLCLRLDQWRKMVAKMIHLETLVLPRHNPNYQVVYPGTKLRKTMATMILGILMQLRLCHGLDQWSKMVAKAMQHYLVTLVLPRHSLNYRMV